MPSLAITQVDAFADRPFVGNPAAVCVLDDALDDSVMQQIAMEMNLAETAFVRPRAGDGFDLRWFTPTVEVDLCGHATLASAHVLWERGLLAPDAEAAFHTRSGRLTARRAGGAITLDFPSEAPAAHALPDGLLPALGVDEVRFGGRNRMDWFVELADAAAVRRLAPDMTRLAAVPLRGVIVTAPASEQGVDFVSRFFGPQSGVAEDPVTGSAHCALAPYWAGRLGRNPLVGYQASTRGGTVRVRVAGARVELTGGAVTVLRGELAW